MAAEAIFAVGLLSGQEVNWLPATTRVLAGDTQNIEMTVSSGHLPDVAKRLATGKLDIAFMGPSQIGPTATTSPS
jgi:LysR family hca operon transcriptional activator